jgi:histidinol dehydrogenase
MNGLDIRMLDAERSGFEEELGRLLAFEGSQDETVDARVKAVIAEVRASGDEALLHLTARFDGWRPADAKALVVPRVECSAALEALDREVRAALTIAAARIRAFHERQLQASWQIEEADGTRLGQMVSPLERVGIYVPGGKAAYPSSVLMNAIPARVAGVGQIVMVTPTPEGKTNPAVLAAAELAGVDRVFRLGGAQAVAALAYGTSSVPAVDKIVGPGNAYVAAAKRQVFGQVGIDMVAGPSEILVIADDGADAEWVATDLLSQAEHDEIAQAILLSPDAALIESVAAQLALQLDALPRAAIARASLAKRGALIKVRDLDEAVVLANRIAPEHLELIVADPDRWLARLQHAGAIFVGAHSCEALGDYCAGPNHVLPTARTARFSSPLGVHDFQKRSSVIRISPRGAASLGALAATLARAEGLEAHARSAELRCKP